ncbi:MAG: recombinase family protein [Firmicutes bacterium]|nr:recombinase family protein [Bacillota bacterium]
MIYGYHRTSTAEQHLDRGITEIESFCKNQGLTLERIYTDQHTGKNFNRPRYQVLKEDILSAIYKDKTFNNYAELWHDIIAGFEYYPDTYSGGGIVCDDNYRQSKIASRVER